MVKIICRIKPPKEDNIKIIDKNKILLLKKDRNLLDNSIVKPYEFELDSVYDYDISTNEIFNNEIKNKIKSKNIGIFIYGHTGSGKTYTLFGDDKSDGIFDLICKELNFTFDIQAIDLKHSGNYDLFNNKKLLIYSDKNENIKHNAEKIFVNKDNYKEIKNQIYSSRISGISKHNYNSSRSHLVIYIFDKKNNITYNIIDLAGNERRPNIHSKENEKEVSFINSSLLALKECFRSYDKKFVPYRRSDLTRLLKNIITDKNEYYNLIITTIHSGFPYFFDSVDTLNYINGLLNKVKKVSSFNERKVKYNQKKKLQKKELVVENPKFDLNETIFNNNEFDLCESDYSDDFYSEPDINDKDMFDDEILKYYDDQELIPYVYSPKKIDIDNDNFMNNEDFYDPNKYQSNLKLSNIFSDEVKDPQIISDFATIDNNDNNDLIDKLISVKEYTKIIESDKSLQYKKKLFGVINNLTYKTCISNYKELLSNDLDDKKISILILNSIATLKMIVKELQSI